IDAEPNDVLLVLRGGKVLSGDAAVVEALGDEKCEALDVCGRELKICAERETGRTIAALRTAAGGNPYPLFFCGEPEKEPSCVPMRPGEFPQSLPDDPDGDGIGAGDLCPDVFDAPRPLDGDRQADADGDGLGDACDPCPLNAHTTDCS